MAEILKHLNRIRLEMNRLDQFELELLKKRAVEGGLDAEDELRLVFTTERQERLEKEETSWFRTLCTDPLGNARMIDTTVVEEVFFDLE